MTFLIYTGFALLGMAAQSWVLQQRDKRRLPQPGHVVKDSRKYELFDTECKPDMSFAHITVPDEMPKEDL